MKRTSRSTSTSDLVELAQRELGTHGSTATVHRALEDVVRRGALERLSTWHFDDPPPEGDGSWNDWIERVGWSRSL
jgi:hypothetical protein